MTSTGSGNSAICEIAALIKPGPTVVVSPLVSLQRDQVEALDTKLFRPVIHSLVANWEVSSCHPLWPAVIRCRPKGACSLRVG